MDVEIDTLVVIRGVEPRLKDGTTGIITRAGAYPDEHSYVNRLRHPRLVAEVRLTSGAYTGRTLSIHLDKLEIAR